MLFEELRKCEGEQWWVEWAGNEAEIRVWWEDVWIYLKDCLVEALERVVWSGGVGEGSHCDVEIILIMIMQLQLKD